MQPTLTRTTPLEDFLNLPDPPPHYELVLGKITRMPSPTYLHQRICKQILRLLDAYILHHQLGELLFAPMDVFMDAENVYQPDLLFIAMERMETLIGEDGKVHGAPDWVCEVLSPSNSQKDTILKKQVYFRFGVKEYWIIDPEDQLLEILTPADTGFKTYRLVYTDDPIESPIFPQLSAKGAAIFN